MPELTREEVWASAMDLREKMRMVLLDLIDAQKERPPHFSVMVALSTIQIEMLYLWGVPTQTDRRAAIADPEEIREWLHAFVDLIIDRGRFDLSPPKDLLQYLGHKNIQHTVRYTEMAPDRFKDFWRGY